ncbi:MAG: peptidoglycan DD-metalloendopeptidase family protein [Bdellovibrionales bacterium]|nr:peptidoglycan DD-metalloendopeptidase family protein [Bdellovibrionales bacterium]
MSAISAHAVPVKPQEERNLKRIQEQVRYLEKSIDSARRTEATLKSELEKLEKLLRLQALEIELGTIEQEKLSERIEEMKLRKSSLEQVIALRKRKVRQMLSALPSLEARTPFQRLTQDNLTQMLLYRDLVDRMVKTDRSELLTLRQQLGEVATLADRLGDDQERLTAQVADLREKQEVLNLNRAAKTDLLKRTREDQTDRLRAFQSAKAAESELEAMLSRFNLAAEVRQEQTSLPGAPSGRGFLMRKGRLPLPLDGELVRAFGRRYDQASSLYTFHKGVDIRGVPGAEVRAVAPGRVVFAGRLGGYGELLILDHGSQYYTLVGQLGESLRKEGDSVAENEVLGRSSLDGTPLYFEIRQRHIAVNPVPWLAMKR